MRAVNPANIIGGFKRSGVCPYDPTAVCITGDIQTQSPPGVLPVDQVLEVISPQIWKEEELKVSGSDGTGASGTTSETGHLAERSGSSDADNNQVDIFPLKQLELFERRCAEGYDLLHDTDYVRWLTLNHPEAMTKHPESSSSSHSPSVSSSLS